MNQFVASDGAEFFGSRISALCVTMLLGVHAGLLAYSATQHSPTINEPANLVAGLCHWKFGRFDVYRVNPPLVHYVAAIPVMISGYKEDWSALIDLPDARSEFQTGDDFIKANGERSIWLFTIARWACIAFSLFGGLICFLWSRELWGRNLAGLISLFLWCFEPNILAHGELITPDCAATSLGLGACYGFWRWLRRPAWGRAVIAGIVLGLALLTKTTWVILFGLWPLIWLIAEWSRCRRNLLATNSQLPACGQTDTISLRRRFSQIVIIIIVGLYVLNLGYGFDGSFTRLKDYTFVSKTLTGLERSGDSGNRFVNSWIGEISVPVPENFLRGIDLQKRTFENYDQRSYVRGEWKQGGWWYYYLYGLAVKTSHGSQLLFLLALFTVVCRTPSTGFNAEWKARDLISLLTPAIAVLALASSQTESNHHVRYVLPVLGFASVFAGATAIWFSRQAVKLPSG